MIPPLFYSLPLEGKGGTLAEGILLFKPFSESPLLCVDQLLTPQSKVLSTVGHIG